MSEVWFTSDTHFGHRNIIKYCDRPFNGVDHMNRAMIDRWNSVVSFEDTVYHLGDACMGSISDTLPLIRELNGYKILVPGNHDRIFSGESRARKERFLPEYSAVFEEIALEQFVYGEGGVDFRLCHFPYLGDSHDADRFNKQRPIDDGLPLVHGHVHDKWRVNGRQINVGVDVWDFEPVHLDVVLRLIEEMA
jgi:calcineurin-like phosphoesterase family protein